MRCFKVEMSITIHFTLEHIYVYPRLLEWILGGIIMITYSKAEAKKALKQMGITKHPVTQLDLGKHKTHEVFALYFEQLEK